MRKTQEVHITPKQFEILIKKWIEESGQELKEFKVEHLSTLEGDSGDYEIDVTAQFVIFGGAEIKVLIECKKYSSPVKRDVIMILESKLRDSSAHKGMVFSTSRFQSGAIEYAKKRGIATVTVQSGNTRFFTKSESSEIANPPPWLEVSDYIGWFASINNENNECYSLIDSGYVDSLREWYKEK